MSTACTYTSNIFTLSTSMEKCSASTAFLKSIFGQPIDVLTGTATISSPVNSLLTKFLGDFNTLGLALIMALFAYVVFHGFLSTVNEGKFGGRDMGHWSYAIRAILPGSLLIPVKGGFCAMQFVIMYFILVGVNLANYVWQQSVDNGIAKGYTPTTPAAISNSIDQYLAEDFVQDTVFQVASVYEFTGKPIPVNSVPLWDSAYAKSAAQSLGTACNQLSAASAYATICQSDLTDMQNNNLAYELAPLGGPGANEATQTSNLPMISINLGNGGKILTGGTYTFNSTWNTGTSNEMKAALPVLNTAAGAISHSTTAAISCGAPDDANSACDLNQAAGAVQQALIKDNPPKPSRLTTVVDGTGKTCEAACYQNDPTNAPVPGLTTQTSCMASGNHKWTTQCYVRSDQTKAKNMKWVKVPAQHLDNSWWYGSRVYLQLNHVMADNISRLASLVSTLATPDSSLVKFTPPKGNPTIPYTITAYAKNFTYENGAMSNFIPAVTATKTGTLSFPGSSAQPDTNVLNGINWNSLISYYAAYHPKGMTKARYLAEAMGEQNNESEITVGGSANNTVGAQYVATNFPADLLQNLKAVPAQYQNPIKLLILMNMLPNDNTKTFTAEELDQTVKNILEVLKYNGVYNGADSGDVGVSSADETTPVNTWINKVFNNLMGKNMPFAGDGQNPGIFAQIYSLGNHNISSLKDVMKASFNTVNNAQKIGLEMIDTVTSSLESTYANINSKLKHDQHDDLEIGAIGSAASAAAGAVPIVGGGLSSAAATFTQMAIQMKMADQMLEIGKQMAWMPIAIMVLTSMFTAGVSFAVILPLTPFILFWAGQIAWVLAVIEAMVAAPLLTLGFTTPGGHQHFGHTVPGLKMLLSVVFRPVLMVLGLLAGMVLTFVVIRFSSQGFQLVSTQILHYVGSVYTGPNALSTTTQNSVPLTQGILACILLFSFCSFMMLAFTKCFSLIYQIPEKVMQWVGGMADKAGQQELQQMSQGMQQSAQQGAQAGGQSTEKGISANQQHMQSEGQADSTMAQGGSQSGQAVNKGVNAAIKPPKGGDEGLKA